MLMDPDGKAPIWVPGKEPGTWVVQPGDSAFSLATDAGISLKQANYIVESQLGPNYIRKSDGMLMSDVEVNDVVIADFVSFLSSNAPTSYPQNQLTISMPQELPTWIRDGDVHEANYFNGVRDDLEYGFRLEGMFKHKDNLINGNGYFQGFYLNRESGNYEIGGLKTEGAINFFNDRFGASVEGNALHAFANGHFTSGRDEYGNGVDAGFSIGAKAYDIEGTLKAGPFSGTGGFTLGGLSLGGDAAFRFYNCNNGGFCIPGLNIGGVKIGIEAEGSLGWGLKGGFMFDSKSISTPLGGDGDDRKKKK